MADKLNTKKLNEVFERASRNISASAAAGEEQREESLNDRKFYSVSGAQWSGRIGEQFANKPQLEFNVVHSAVMRVINEHRTNEITVDFVSKEGDENDDLADVCDDLFRADEQDSGANEAYDNAFEEAAGGGFGAWRLTTEYEDEYDDEDDRQRIRLEPIYDADTCVYFDTTAKRYDKSDAKWAGVLTGMSPQDFEDEYDEDPTTWPRPIEDDEFEWTSADLVYICEYYAIEETSAEVFYFSDLTGEITKKYTDEDFERDDELLKRLKDTGWRQTKSKKVKRRRVHKYIMSGCGVLEDCGYIAGTEIPIIPVYGKRWFVDGTERFMGAVRLAKDAQRLKNMLVSYLADITARGGISRPIFMPEQIANFELLWANEATENPAYMLLNPMFDAQGQMMPAGPIGYTKAPEVPQSLAVLLQTLDVDIKDILGNQEAGEEVQTNLSGRAIELVQQRLDMQSLIYMSNFVKSVMRCGAVWLSMAKDVYVEDGRKMKGISRSGKMSSIKLSSGGVYDDDGGLIKGNDLSRAKYDVWADVGPTSSSKRAATVRAVTSMLPLVQDPETNAVLTAVAMKNLEGQGISGLNEYFRKKLVQMGVEEPTDEEREQMEAAAAAQGQQQPGAQDQFLIAKAQEAAASAMLDQAKVANTAADTEKKKAETAETLSGIQLDKQSQSLKAKEAFDSIVSGINLPSSAGSGGPL